MSPCQIRSLLEIVLKLETTVVFLTLQTLTQKYMVQGIFSWVDLVMTPVWLLLLYLLAYTISHVKYKDPYLRKHFMWGLTVKFIGCFGFIAVYAFYYGYGDTFGYYRGATTLRQALISNPGMIVEVLKSANLNQAHQAVLDLEALPSAYANPANFSVVRFTLLFGLFTFNSYVATSIFFAFASFIGIWTLYRVVIYLYPHQYKAVTIPILYIPSVFFWGSSMMKDSIVIGFVGLLTYSIYQVYFRKKKILISLLVILMSIYILTNVKQYVIIAYAPALILWISIGPLNRLPTQQRWLAMPFLLAIGLAIIVVLFPVLEKTTQRYTLEKVMETAETTANYIHRTTREGGSRYSLGEVSYTPLGMAKVFPRAVTVTLFQPFLFQVRNPVMLLSALESLVFLLGTFYVLIKVGIFRFIGYIFNQPFLLMCLVFSVFFAFAIGISTYNFGSLVRYKIPCLPFYGIALIIPYMMYHDRNK